MAANNGKPKVLVLGGVGFIGRNFVEYLSDNNLASKIKVADKVLPDLAGLSAKQVAIFKSDLVEFKQANLARQRKSLQKQKLISIWIFLFRKGSFLTSEIWFE